MTRNCETMSCVWMVTGSDSWFPRVPLTIFFGVGLFNSLTACCTCSCGRLFRWFTNSSSISECRFSTIHCLRCMPIISVRSSVKIWLTTHSSEREVGRLTSFSAAFCVSSSSLSSGTVNVFIDFDDECTKETESATEFETDSPSDSTAFTAEGSENPVLLTPRLLLF